MRQISRRLFSASSLLHSSSTSRKRSSPHYAAKKICVRHTARERKKAIKAVIGLNRERALAASFVSCSLWWRGNLWKDAGENVLENSEQKQTVIIAPHTNCLSQYSVPFFSCWLFNVLSARVGNEIKSKKQNPISSDALIRFPIAVYLWSRTSANCVSSFAIEKKVSYLIASTRNIRSTESTFQADWSQNSPSSFSKRVAHFSCIPLQG